MIDVKEQFLNLQGLSELTECIRKYISYAQENLDTIIGYLDDYISQDDIDAIFV